MQRHHVIAILALIITTTFAIPAFAQETDLKTSVAAETPGVEREARHHERREREEMRRERQENKHEIREENYEKRKEMRREHKEEHNAKKEHREEMAKKAHEDCAKGDKKTCKAIRDRAEKRAENSAEHGHHGMRHEGGEKH